MSVFEPVFFPNPTKPEPFRHSRVPSLHVEMSQRMIADIAGKTRHHRALLLCDQVGSEVPFVQLVQTYDHLVLGCLRHDPKNASLIPGPLQSRVTRLTFDDFDQPLIDAAQAAVQEASDSLEAIHTVLERISTQPPRFGPIGEHDLVVVSGLFSKIHVATYQVIRHALLRRFPDASEHMGADWIAGMTNLRNQLQAAFIAWIGTLVSDTGRLYLSAPTKVCQIERLPSGEWSSEGWLRMTPHLYLAELIKPPLEVETSDMWPWVLSPPQEAGQTGVLYRVEALELRRQACSGKPS